MWRAYNYRVLITRSNYDLDSSYRAYDIDILEPQISGHHIHMMIRLEPKATLYDLMRVVKTISSRKIFKLRPEIKKEYFREGRLGLQNYFVETIGSTNEELICARSANQLVEMNR